MSSISPSVLKNLSQLVPDSLYYICLVEYRSQPWYLSLGKDQFYFISQDLKYYLHPAIKYSKIEACLLCSKRKTLMQIKLKFEEQVGVFGAGSGSQGSEDAELKETYGDAGKLNIYNQDRQAAVDSFTCYWQISTIRQRREYQLFPLIEKVTVQVEEDDQQDPNQEGLNLKKQFKLPKSFFKPSGSDV
jgi:hypothetical protein